jgi:GNAT superfamily N-acetyltransferase
MEIRFITADQTIPLRHLVLRPHQPVNVCQYPADQDPQTFHLGFFLSGTLVSIATFQHEVLKELQANVQFRLRGMATLPEWRGYGFGAQLVQKGLDVLNGKGAELLWCNARQVAFGFYEKMGFDYLGPLFTIDPIGPHKVMYRKIDR